VDILFGHSTGGLIATMYADYKNSLQDDCIKQLILSSPFFDWYSDPASKSYFGSERFLETILSPLGLLLPNVNVKWSSGSPNKTSCQEFNELNFNPMYKSLREPKTLAKWIRACTKAHHKIPNKQVNVKCKVVILCSDKSKYWEYSVDSDNVLDVQDIKKYGKLISNDVEIYEIENSIHHCFLRVNIEDYLSRPTSPSTPAP